MSLKLSLKPSEKFVVNGAVMQNGERRSVILLQNRASVLREKDIMQSAEVTSPARRIYFPVMLMYLEGATGKDRNYEEFVLRVSEFMGAVRNPAVIKECVNLSRDVMAANYYKALGRCRKLMIYERERLGHVDSGLSEGGTEHRRSA